MQGRVIKIFSDFYYVETDIGIVEAKLRTVLKKQKEEVVTGDFVILEQLDKASMQAFISGIVERKNLILRPKVANVTQVIIVSALKEPALNFEQLDRYIAHCEYHKISPVLCFNKEDLSNVEDLKEQVLKVYSPLNYKILFTSALEQTGIDELKPILKDNISILCGSSGVGKSSLINTLLQSSKQRILPVSEKTKKGVHTTRHCELMELSLNAYVVDTPGFSHLKFDFLLPAEIRTLFAEFRNTEPDCKYRNCVHTGEDGCSYTEIIEKMSQDRYESYKKFVEEARQYQEKISKKSVKNEANVKFNQNKIMTKISEKKRNVSRKTSKQKLSWEEI